MKDLILPDRKKFETEFLINYGKQLLELNGLDIGDEIEIQFDYETVKSRYKSRELDKYTYQKLAKGILKTNEEGCLYAESLDDMVFYEYTRQGRKYYYKQVMRKSIKMFGVGFIY